jgi:hypothetical protein
MNHRLEQLAQACRLQESGSEPLRLAFGLACVERVAHLLEEPKAVECLDVLRAAVAGGPRAAAALAEARVAIADIASKHQGSNSIDGTAHAAVSATYAVANALAGRPLEAASYAAYATVYAYGGYAVKDPTAFEAEFEWQVGKLRDLSQERPLAWKP